MTIKIFNFSKARILSYMDHHDRTGTLHKNMARTMGGRNLPAYTTQFKSYIDATDELKNQKIRKMNTMIFEFEDDLELLKSNFRTESSKFMFPTVLSKYRRGMNPVRALYCELQKTLFQYDKDNDMHNWMIDLFSDDKWFRDLLLALESDYVAITKFQQAHLPQSVLAKCIERDLSVLNNVKENIKHFVEVFSLMNGCDLEYLQYT